MVPFASRNSESDDPHDQPRSEGLTACVDVERVAFLAGSPTQRDVLLQLAELTGNDWLPSQRAQFLKALFDREEVTTTAIGGGIAVPHARLTHLDHCRITLGLAPAGIAWRARDQQPVRLIVLIAAREQERTEHLRLLAEVASRMADLERRERVITAGSADEALRELTG